MDLHTLHSVKAKSKEKQGSAGFGGTTNAQQGGTRKFKW